MALTTRARFFRSTEAVAAIEFAVIAPALLVMTVASYDVGRAVDIYMKVRSATITLASIANQYTTGGNDIEPADMQAITGATSAVLAPYPTQPVTATITQIEETSKNSATVSWSYSLGGTAYAQGSSWSSLPKQLKNKNPCNSYPCYLLLAEVSYDYAPLFGSSITGPISLSDSMYVTPRSSVCVQYAGTPSSC